VNNIQLAPLKQNKHYRIIARRIVYIYFKKGKINSIFLHLLNSNFFFFLNNTIKFGLTIIVRVPIYQL
jgi:hypothetical protein